MRKSESTPRYFPSYLVSAIFFLTMPSLSVLSQVVGNLCFPFPLELHQGIYSFLHPFQHPSAHRFFCCHPFPSLSSILHSRVSPHSFPNIILLALWQTNYPAGVYGEEWKTIYIVLNWKDLRGTKGQLLFLRPN